MFDLIDNIIAKLKNLSRMMTIILFSTIALFDFLINVSTFPNRFFPVIGQMITMIIVLALDLSIPLLLIIRKDKLAKIAFYLVGFYTLLNVIFNGLNYSQGITNNADTLLLLYRIFGFVATLAFISMIVLYIISRIKHNNLLESIMFLIFASAMTLLFTGLILVYIYYGKNDIGWVSWFSRFEDLMIMPAALLFGFLHFIYEESNLFQDSPEIIE